MRQWMAWLVLGSMACAIAISCNTIAGIDDLAGLECQTAADCPPAGECTTVSCNDSRCAYGVAFAQACAQGVCNDEGVCVECISQDGCTGRLLPLCNIETQRCVECGSDADCPGASCHHNKCLECWDEVDSKKLCDEPGRICSPIDGRCVECDIGPNCSNEKLPDQQCWTLVCANRICVPTPTEGKDCIVGKCLKNGVCSPLPP
jgi:hypothetical protein